ncbi:MAG TPA: hypothetical protein VFE37_25005 [Chloroflexota bacterium]|nr:hypothetical protein [Chloroflexota bacterium]
MTRRLALLISSALTVFVLVLGVGIAARLQAPAADAASPADQPAAATAIFSPASAPVAASAAPAAERRDDDARRSGEPRDGKRPADRAARAPERDDHAAGALLHGRPARGGDRDD